MDQFKRFSNAVDARVSHILKKGTAFRVDVTRDELWEVYLSAFPEGTNPMFRERTEHDCNCCKHFVRNIGDMVVVDNGKLLTIWDVKTGDFYEEVAKKMNEYVLSKPIANLYFCHDSIVGAAGLSIVKDEDSGTEFRFTHFSHKLPSRLVNADPGSVTGNVRETKSVLKRSLEEISKESVELVLELIDQNSLYRGQEHKPTLETLSRLQAEYGKLRSRVKKDIFLWENAVKMGGSARIRNTVIGTLLVDLSDGVDLETAVKAFETKVAPENYRRPTALITKGMIKEAEKTVTRLGMEESLNRRFATAEDLTINNVLFADRSVKPAMGGGIFEELASTAVKKQSFDKIEEVSIDHFLESILPKAESVEVMVENKHENNLMSLIAPVDKTSPCMFKWDNNFSWSYNGEVADSIKERVKKAGGKVDGYLRCSLSWDNKDDLDLHVIEPSGNEIYFGDELNRKTRGNLDVDANASFTVPSPVENITWPERSKMETGRYVVVVHQFRQREKKDYGFSVEIECNGETFTFSYDQELKGRIKVAEFDFNHRTGEMKMISNLQSSQKPKDFWGIRSNDFRKVSMVMNSPNYWDGQKGIGNRHTFFILEGCKNPEDARGFYNEFLSVDLNKHRKVFEVLGSRLKAKHSEDQLSGLGFSSTKKDAIICRVSGKFNRTIKVKF